MNQKEVKPFSTSQFYVIAEKLRQRMVEEEDILQENMTDIFWDELEYMVKNKEIVIININAKMRLGKSTEACAIGAKLFDFCKKYYGEETMPEKEFGIKQICADQQEKQEDMTDEKVHHTVRITDESNESEKGGANATAEQQQREDQSNIQAGRYVHSINCSPKEIIDNNADIMLSIIAVDKRQYMIRNKLYYRYYEGGHEFIQLLGYVDIYVGHIIKNWVHIVEPEFFKKEPKIMRLEYGGDKCDIVGSKEHKKYVVYCEKYKKSRKVIKEMQKKDWYVKYQIRKYYLIDLPQKKGIQRKRLLKYAHITLDIVNEYKELIKYIKVTKEIVNNDVRIAMKKNKIPTSIVGEKMATEEIMGVLEFYKAIHTLEKDLEKEEKSKNPYMIKINEINEGIRKLQNKLNKVIEEFELMKETNDEIKTILKD